MGEKTVTVWCPAGKVERNALLQAAINEVKADIGIVYALNAELLSGVSKPLGDERGTEYTLKVTWDGEGERPVDVEAYVKALDTPSFSPASEGDA